MTYELQELVRRLRDSNEKRQRIISRLVEDNHNLTALLPPNQRGRRIYAETALHMKFMEARIEELERKLSYARYDNEAMKGKLRWWQNLFQEKKDRRIGDDCAG